MFKERAENGVRCELLNYIAERMSVVFLLGGGGGVMGQASKWSQNMCDCCCWWEFAV